MSNALQVVKNAPRRTPLAQVIREMIADGETGDKNGKCRGFGVIHVSQRGDREIDAIKLGSSEWTPEKLADRIEAKAKTYAQDLSGAQTFTLLAFYGDAKDYPEPQATHPFVINGNLGTDFDRYGSLTTEGPDAKGQMQQAMRLTEVIVQRVFGMASSLFEEQRLERQELRRENQELKAENREAFSLLRESIMQNTELSHQKRMQEMEYLRSTEERKMWFKFAPALINQIVGREVFPQGTADSALVDSIAEALDEKTIQKIAGELPPTLWGPLAARFESHIKKKRMNAEAQAKRLTEGAKKTDEEIDAEVRGDAKT